MWRRFRGPRSGAQSIHTSTYTPYAIGNRRTRPSRLISGRSGMEIILAHYHKEVGTRANRVFRRVHDHDAALSEIFQKWRDYFLILETQGPTRSDGDGVEEETSAQRYGFLSHLRSPVGIRADKRRRGGLL